MTNLGGLKSPLFLFVVGLKFFICVPIRVL